MRKPVKLLTGLLSVILIISSLGFSVSAGGDYEAPTDVRVSIDDVVIDKSELKQDSVVRVPIRIDNNPGFCCVEVIVSLDSPLQYDPDGIYLKNVDINNLAGVSFSDAAGNAKLDGSTPLSSLDFKFMSSSRKRITDNGIMGFLQIRVPDYIPVGKYSLSFKLTGRNDQACSILTYNNYDAWFGSECFTLKNGSITITDKSNEKEQDKVPSDTPTETPSTPTIIPSSENSESGIGAFVERLYKDALARESDKDGKDYWVTHVNSGELSGADCAREFLFSKEFRDRNLSDEVFLKILYRTFFDRNYEDDPDGYNFWLGYLKTNTRDSVINGFIESTEWCNICATYGVRSGAIYAKATVASENSIRFATRLYKECLGRNPEADGQRYWSLGLTNQELTGTQAAKEFFYSKEFKDKNLSDEEYVYRLYRTFMGRYPEDSGKEYWLTQLKNGTSRDAVFDFFSTCPEFTDICNEYAIRR